MLDVYVDGDACPVKDEVYRVALRHELKVYVVSDGVLRASAPAEVLLRDEHIAMHKGAAIHKIVTRQDGHADDL
jgi:uncharacterized protein YaiI (UPF0178 family)